MTWDQNAIIEKIVAKLRSKGASQQDVDKHNAYHHAALTEFERHYTTAYPTASFLAMGGSGIVLKLVAPSLQIPGGDKGQLPREAKTVCLKYPHPHTGGSETFQLSEVLDNEAQKLSQIHHQHIMPLEETWAIDIRKYDNVSESDALVPSYLMPYIESAELGDFARGAATTPKQIITLLRQAADALAYIHEAHLIHLDIKPANILVSKATSGEPEALVADFGFCKRIHTGGETGTLAAGTDGYISPELLRLMASPTTTNENRVRDRVPRDKLTERLDRFAFGATILDTCVAYLSTGPERTIPTDLLRGLILVALQCSGKDSEAMRAHPRYPGRAELARGEWFSSRLAEAIAYTSTDELAADLKRLDGTNRLAFVEPEIAETTGSTVCLPERVFVPLSQRVTRTLDSILVRRLGTISQLALCSHVYPGATHTRKEHVLGTFRVTCRFLRQLVLDSANPLGAFILKQRQQRLAMLSALLHDMAHVPLMHEFEDSVPKLRQRRFTSELLSLKWGGKDFEEDLRGVLNEWDVTADELRLVLGSADDPPDNYSGATNRSQSKIYWERDWERVDIQLIRGIIDGAVDADKVDYLQRDALHAGVRFGHGVEAERIETHITAIVESDAGRSSGTRVRCSMGIWRKGLAAGESLIGVRHSMYSQVYAHRTVRAARAMLNYVVWKWRTSSHYASNDEDQVASALFGFASGLGPRRGDAANLFEPTRSTLAAELVPRPMDNLGYMDASVVRWMAAVSNDTIAKQMAEDLITRNLYKEVLLFSATEVPTFLKTAFTKSRKGYEGALEATEWLRLLDHLKIALKGYLSSGESMITIDDSGLPSLLVDVAIPKTMRTQAELRVLDNDIGSATTWKRLKRIDAQKGWLLGLRVAQSPVYDAYGGQSEDLAPLQVRVFARPGLAQDLRPRLEGTVVQSWLETFRI